MLLPVGTAKEVDALCVNFLWAYETHHVKWQVDIYLRIRDILLCEKAAGDSLVWRTILDTCQRLVNSTISSGGGLDLRASRRQLTFKEAFDMVRHRADSVLWAPLLWNDKVVPKHACVLYRALMDRLPTLDQLSRHGLHAREGGGDCYLCEQHCETSNHLFYSCSYSVAVWNAVVSAMELHPISASNLLSMLDWCSKISCNKMKLKIGAVLAATTWAIRAEHNTRWTSEHRSPISYTIRKIFTIVAVALY